MSRVEHLSEDVTLYLGDCRDLLPGLEFDAVVSDPPYGIGWTRGVNKARGSKSHAGILNDHDTSARDAVLDAAGGRPAVLFGSFYAKFPESLKQILVWQKPADSGLVGSVTGFRRDAEPIFLCGKWPQRNCEASSVIRSNGGQAAIVSETGHPHTKPVPLMYQLVKLTPGNVILDPFMGSGTTGVACVQAGRSFIGVELEPRYFDIACRRLADVLRRPRLDLAPVAKPVQEAMQL